MMSTRLNRPINSLEGRELAYMLERSFIDPKKPQRLFLIKGKWGLSKLLSAET